MVSLSVITLNYFNWTKVFSLQLFNVRLTGVSVCVVVRRARVGLLVFGEVALLQEVLLEHLDQLRVGVIQRRVEQRLGHVQHPISLRLDFLRLDGFLFVADEASESVMFGVVDAQDVARTTQVRVAERNEIRDPLVGTWLSPKNKFDCQNVFKSFKTFPLNSNGCMQKYLIGKCQMCYMMRWDNLLESWTNQSSQFKRVIKLIKL